MNGLNILECRSHGDSQARKTKGGRVMRRAAAWDCSELLIQTRKGVLTTQMELEPV